MSFQGISHRYRPHRLNPTKESTRVLFVYKNFAARQGISHIGLGVSALNTSKVLQQHGFWTHVQAIINSNDLIQYLQRENDHAHTHNQVPYTHVVISAPWIPTLEMMKVISMFPDIHFVMVCHSNVGFLQADTNGVKILREAMDLQVGSNNFVVAGNCDKFTEWVRAAFGVPCITLHNLYDTSHFGKTPHKNFTFNSSLVRIGCFGATRVLKNLMTAAGAALEIKSRLNVDLEFWISGGRTDGGQGVINAITQMLSGIPGVQLKESNWQPWAGFRRIVSHMDLLLQPSFTESFNMVTADGIAEGVTSVVSEAIDWVPDSWQAHFDRCSDIADKGIALLYNPHAIENGKEALIDHVELGIRHWERYLLHKT